MHSTISNAHNIPSPNNAANLPGTLTSPTLAMFNNLISTTGYAKMQGQKKLRQNKSSDFINANHEMYHPKPTSLNSTEEDAHLRVKRNLN
jgi:hypothetical protein